jgi:methionyl aminopeptidase
MATVVVLKSEAEIAAMRAAGAVVARTLRLVAQAAKPGVTLLELDAIAADAIAAAGAKPSFLGYHPSWAPAPYPGVLCLSVDDAVVHGIPDHRVLADGDLLSVDCGAHLDGYHGDAALTVAIGAVDHAAQRLTAATAEAHAAGIAAARPGGRIGDISHAVEAVARAGGYGLPHSLGGHGIGTAMHEARRCPTPAAPAVACRCAKAWSSPSSRCSSSRAGTPAGPARTAGRWSPPTAAAPPTSSTPSPSPRAVRWS